MLLKHIALCHYNATLQVSPCTIQFLLFVQKLRLNKLMRSIIGQYNKSGMVDGRNALERYASSGPKKLAIPLKQKNTTNNSEVLHSTLLNLLRRFCLKTGINFAHFGLESGMVFGGTTRVYERIYRFNSK